MGARRWEITDAGTAIQQWSDERSAPRKWTKTEMDDENTDFIEILTLSDTALTRIQEGNIPSGQDLASFKRNMERDVERNLDRTSYIDDWDSGATPGTFALDSGWISPDQIEGAVGVGFCGEEVGSEATRSIDGVNANTWEHNQTHLHFIVYRLRPALSGIVPRVRIEGIRFRHSGSGPNKEKLQDVKIYAANQVADLTDAANLIYDGAVDGQMTWVGGTWVEPPNLSEAIAKYVRIETNNTDHPSDFIEVAEIQFLFGTQDHPG